MRSKLSTTFVSAIIVLAISGCGDNTFQAPPPPTVTVSAPMSRDVIEYVVLPAATSPESSVDVRARVQGVLQEVRYQPGEMVEEGDPLFLIDPTPFVSARDALQAKVENAEAQVRLAETKAERIERSARDGAISELQALEARAEAEAAIAALQVVQEELAIAQLDVDYTEISAPISGLIEKSPFGVGDLVGNSAETGMLTTIHDDTKIHVLFSVSDRVYLSAMRAGAEERERPSIDIATELDDDFPFTGRIDYAEPSVDETTGTLLVRAVVDNEDRELLGGLFVRIRFAVQTLSGALLVPQSAIGSDQIGPYVLVVDGEGVVERRNVVLGPQDGPDQVILDGVGSQDRVVIRGLLKARPGSTVNAEESGS